MNRSYIGMVCLALIVFNNYAKQSLDNPEELLATLSLRDKIAQLIIAAAVSNEDLNREFMKQSPYRMDKSQLEFLIKHCHIGGILFLGSGIKSEQIARTKYYQKISDIPLLVAADAEYGTGMRLRDGSIYPKNKTLAAIQDETLLYDMGYYIGLELQQMGVHLSLGPVLDIDSNPENPVIGDRALGSNPSDVAQKGTLIIRGLKSSGIMACAKHFPGHGDTLIDSHVALPTVTKTRQELEQLELIPFKVAIENNVDAMMIAHIAVSAIEPAPNMPGTLSKKIITEFLKEELGFEGLIITDGLGMCGVTMHQSGSLELQALLAGADILLCPRDPALAIKSIMEAVEQGRITEEYITQKALRVLQAKKCAFARAEHVRSSIAQDEIQNLRQKMYQQAVTLVFDKRSQMASETTLTVVPPSRYGSENFGITSEQLQQLEQKREEGLEITIVIFGTPYAAEFFAPYADRLIVAYEDTPETRQTVENIMRGTFTPCGKLPIDINI